MKRLWPTQFDAGDRLTLLAVAQCLFYALGPDHRPEFWLGGVFCFALAVLYGVGERLLARVVQALVGNVSNPRADASESSKDGS